MSSVSFPPAGRMVMTDLLKPEEIKKALDAFAGLQKQYSEDGDLSIKQITEYFFWKFCFASCSRDIRPQKVLWNDWDEGHDCRKCQEGLPGFGCGREWIHRGGWAQVRNSNTPGLSFFWGSLTGETFFFRFVLKGFSKDGRDLTDAETKAFLQAADKDGDGKIGIDGTSLLLSLLVFCF